jgi:hypothetical protein
MKNLSKFTGIIAVAAAIVFLAACDTGVGGGPQTGPYTANPGTPGNPGSSGTSNVAVVYIGRETAFDYMIVRRDGAAMFINADETRTKPTSLYFRPNKNSDKGVAMFFKENGLPDFMTIDGYIVYFGNFTGYTYDLAVIKPDGEIEYHYNIQTDRNFNSSNVRPAIRPAPVARGINTTSRSIGNIHPETWFDFDLYDLASWGVTLGTCVAAIAAPVLAPVAGPMCVSGFFSMAASITVPVLADVFLDGEAEIVVSAAASVVIDGLGCPGNPFECAQGVIGIGHTLLGVGMDLADERDQKLLEAIKHIEQEPVPRIYFEGLSANGTSNSTTTKLTLKISVEDQDPGLSADDITLNGRRTGAVKGGLTKTGTGYELAVYGINRSGSVTVSISKPGYIASPFYSREVAVFVSSRPLQFTSLAADGSDASPDKISVMTTKLTLAFSEDVDKDDLYNGITLSGATGAGKSGITRTGDGVYELALSNITLSGPLTVSVSVPDYFITGQSSRSVTVYAVSAPYITTWAPAEFLPSGGYNMHEPSKIAYGNSSFLAIGSGQYGGGYNAMSADGAKWVYTRNMDSVNGWVLAYGDGWFLAGDGSGSIERSIDGQTWIYKEINFPESRNSINAIAYGEGRFVLIYNGNKFAWSTD